MNASLPRQPIDLRRAETLYEMERHREAIQELNRLLALEPENARILCHLAANYGELKEYDDRWLDYAERALAADPDNAWGHRLRCLALRQKGDKREALAEARRAVAADPSVSRGYHVLILCLRDVFRVAEAQEAGELLRELAPDQAETYQTLAEISLDAGEWTDAEENARRAIALDPEDFRAFRLLGQSLSPQNRSREALDAYYEASRLAPAKETLRAIFVNCLNAHCFSMNEDLTPEPAANAPKERRLLWKFRHVIGGVLIPCVMLPALMAFGYAAMVIAFILCLAVILFMETNPAIWHGRRWRALPPAMRRLYLLQTYRFPIRFAPQWIIRSWGDSNNHPMIG